MSIYPVPLQKWFPTNKQDSESQYMHETVKWLVSITKCIKCNKHCKFNRAWGHHSIFVGYGDIWCSEKCMRSK